MTENYEYMPRAMQDPDVEYPLTIKYCGGQCFCSRNTSIQNALCLWSIVNFHHSLKNVEHGQRKIYLKSLNDLILVRSQFSSYIYFKDDVDSNQTEATPKGRQVRGGKGGPKKPVKQQIAVFKTSRGKKKYTTSVTGLSTFGRLMFIFYSAHI